MVTNFFMVDSWVDLDCQRVQPPAARRCRAKSLAMATRASSGPSSIPGARFEPLDWSCRLVTTSADRAGILRPNFVNS